MKVGQFYKTDLTSWGTYTVMVRDIDQYGNPEIIVIDSTTETPLFARGETLTLRGGEKLIRMKRPQFHAHYAANVPVSPPPGMIVQLDRFELPPLTCMYVENEGQRYKMIVLEDHKIGIHTRGSYVREFRLSNYKPVLPITWKEK